jgi:hypothetical protein
MSDVVLGFGVNDQASPKIRKIKQEVDATGRAAARTGQALGRMGGPLGGVAGRALGGFSGGGALGAAGAAAAIAGLAVNAALASDARRVQALINRLETQVRVDDANRGAGKARIEQQRGRDLAGMSFIDVMRLAASRGPDIGFQGRIRRSAGRGIDVADAAAAETQNLLTPVSRREYLSGQANLLAATGEISMVDAIKRLQPRTGSIDLARELVGIREQILNPQNLTQAQDQINRTRLMGGQGEAATKAAVARNISGVRSLDALLGDRTTAEITRAENQDPGAEILAELSRSANQQARILEAAAREQSGFAALLQSYGRTFGMGEGSQRERFWNFQAANAPILNPGQSGNATTD